MQPMKNGRGKRRKCVGQRKAGRLILLLEYDYNDVIIVEYDSSMILTLSFSFSSLKSLIQLSQTLQKQFPQIALFLFVEMMLIG